MPRIIFFIISMLLFSTFSSASSVEIRGTVLGKWKTFDDDTGEARSVVELYEKKGKLFGKIIKFFPKPGESVDPVCEECEGDYKNKKILGMIIIDGLTKEGEVWGKGQVLDPENGELYDCNLWLENGNVRIRGYLLFLYRTQTWMPYL